MVGQPGITIAPPTPHHGYPHFNQAQSPPHQPLQGSTGPEVHPGRKPHCRQAPGSPEERQRGGPTGKSHPRTSGLAVFTPGTQPFQTEMRAVAAPHSGPKVRPLELVARGWGWGSLEGAALGPQPRGPASKCLPGSSAAAPAAGGPLLPETSSAPRLCPDPDSPRGARTQSYLGALQARRPRDSTSGWILHPNAAGALSRLSCPGDPTQSG